MSLIVAALWLGLCLGFLLGWITRLHLEQAQRASRELKDLNFTTDTVVPKGEVWLVHDKKIVGRITGLPEC